jgi:membrane fusion protein (multidrug efflux system)
MDGSQFAGPAEPQAGVSAPARRRPWPLRRLAIALGALVALGGLADYGHYYWTEGRFLVSTEDATVQADSVIVSPRVSGYIAAVLVADNQPVRAGQVLARIDDRDDRAARAQARAALAAAAAGIDNLRQEITRQRLVVHQARAAVAADEAALTFSREQYARYARLAHSGAGTEQQSQQWQADIAEKQAALARDTAGVGVAVQQIAVLRTALARASATRAERQAALRQADLTLGYTTITAPVTGTVGDRTLRVGQYVQAGTALMAVVPLAAVYVTADYKETTLTDVRPGQPVAIAVDTFPDATVHGVVDSISPASGAEFALLPPDNATGNYTKIVQRIPVRIRLDPHDPLLGRLRPGMSVEPTINTKPHS